jgi:hypothetical protein
MYVSLVLTFQAVDGPVNHVMNYSGVPKSAQGQVDVFPLLSLFPSPVSLSLSPFLWSP